MLDRKGRGELKTGPIVNLSFRFTRPAGVVLYRKEFSRSGVAKLWAYLRQAPRITSAVRLSTPAGRLSSYRNEWRHFLACIASRSRPTPNFYDGLAVTRAP
jgi:hypothetical protein